MSASTATRMTTSLLWYFRVCPSQTAHPAGFARS